MRTTILCVDDEPVGLFLRKVMLEQEGYRVLIASDGKQALASLKSSQVDAVILDFSMPDMDGGEVARRLRREFPRIKIVMLTGYPDAVSSHIRGLLDGFVCKGENPNELLVAIRTALDGTEYRVEGDLSSPETGQSMNLLYQGIVDSAVSLMRSEYASVQMLFPERGTGGELRLLAFQGFNPQAAKFWEWVRADSKSTCGIALRDKMRVVAPDIASCAFMAGSDDQQVYLETGIRACQTTPLIGKAGDVVGMISTHWRTPHQPSENDFRLFDTLARQAADLIEGCSAQAQELGT